MDHALQSLLPLLQSRGFRARRWRWPWSRTWTFTDGRNTIEFSRVGQHWRLRRFRRERGLNWIVADPKTVDWTVAPEQLELAAKELIPALPWWTRHRAAAMKASYSNAAAT